MNDLRQAAQQALEALEAMQSYAAAERKGLLICDESITALRAALAEPDVPETNFGNMEPVGWFEGPFGEFRANQLFKHSWPAQTVAWSIPLYLAFPQRPAEPMQEPVAWMHTDAYNSKNRHLEWSENRRGYLGDWIKTPLFTAPPQRKPLTREQAIALWADKSDGPSNSEIVSYCRAIERAHGIGGKDE